MVIVTFRIVHVYTDLGIIYEWFREVSRRLQVRTFTRCASLYFAS